MTAMLVFEQNFGNEILYQVFLSKDQNMFNFNGMVVH